MSTHHGNPLIRREVSLGRRKPGPQPASPSRDEIFIKLYAAALQGVAGQFEVAGLPGHKVFFSEGEGELVRAKKLATRAWNMACYAVNMFEESRCISAFDEEVGA
jgi:hypothetical protein